ncbi:hypothetical protein AGMMS49949_00170 [Alphaproteobacteria bacterium]|nr:hypothetical protein AGMMS49949_00170 [Alphaproteobacteria bacterium]
MNRKKVIAALGFLGVLAKQSMQASFDPIRVLKENEVENGFLGMNKYVVVRVGNLLGRSDKTRKVAGMCAESYAWIKVWYFKKGPRIRALPSCPESERKRRLEKMGLPYEIKHQTFLDFPKIEVACRNRLNQFNSLNNPTENDRHEKDIDIAALRWVVADNRLYVENREGCGVTPELVGTYLNLCTTEEEAMVQLEYLKPQEMRGLTLFEIVKVLHPFILIAIIKDDARRAFLGSRALPASERILDKVQHEALAFRAQRDPDALKPLLRSPIASSYSRSKRRGDYWSYGIPIKMLSVEAIKNLRFASQLGVLRRAKAVLEPDELAALEDTQPRATLGANPGYGVPEMWLRKEKWYFGDSPVREWDILLLHELLFQDRARAKDTNAWDAKFGPNCVAGDAVGLAVLVSYFE